MNEQIEKLLTRLADGIDSTTTFLVGEIPDVLNQILVFHLSKGLLFLCLSFLILYYVFKLVKTIKFYMSSDFDSQKRHFLSSDLSYVCAWVYVVVGPIAGVLLAVASLLDVIKIWLAPKLYLIEYISSVVK